jgi:hypothetical protein
MKFGIVRSHQKLTRTIRCSLSVDFKKVFGYTHYTCHFGMCRDRRPALKIDQRSIRGRSVTGA